MPEIILNLGDEEVGRYAFGGDEITIGRSEGNDIRVNNPSVSRRHAQIQRDGDRYILMDLDSANGSYVNGARVARTQIFHNDKITIGKHTLRFLAPEIPTGEKLSDIEKTIVLDRAAWTPTLKVFAPNHRDVRMAISAPVTRIGRARENDLRLVDWFVDQHQAEIVKEGQVYRLRNLSKRHNTMLNDLPVEEAFLSEGDIIQAGVSRIFFTLEATGGAPGPMPAWSGGIAAEPEPVEEAPPPFEPFPEAIPASNQEAEEGLVAEWEEPEGEEAPVFEEESALGAEWTEIEPASEEELMETPLAEEEPAEALPMEIEDAEILEPMPAAQEQEEAPELLEEEEAELLEEEAPALLEEEEPESLEAEASAEAEEEPGISEADRRAIAMWESALQNKSLAVRKQAAVQLKKLTGRDYAI